MKKIKKKPPSSHDNLIYMITKNLLTKKSVFIATISVLFISFFANIILVSFLIGKQNKIKELRKKQEDEISHQVENKASYEKYKNNYEKYKNNIDFLITTNYDSKKATYSVDKIDFSSLEVMNIKKYDDFLHFKIYYSIPPSDEKTSDYWGYRWADVKSKSKYFTLWKGDKEYKQWELNAYNWPICDGFVIDEKSNQIFMASGQNIKIHSLEDFSLINEITLPQSDDAIFLKGYDNQTELLYARKSPKADLQSPWSDNGLVPITISMDGVIQETKEWLFYDQYLDPQLRSDTLYKQQASVIANNFVFGEDNNYLLNSLVKKSTNKGYEGNLLEVKVTNMSFHTQLINDFFVIDLPCEHDSDCDLVFAK